PYRQHSALRVLQALIDRGAPAEALFALATRFTWPGLEDRALPSWVPPGWPDALRDLVRTAALDSWLQSQDAAWQTSINAARRALEGVTFKPFLAPFLGAIPEDLIFVPNIGQPSDQEVAVRAGRSLVSITPPRIAWGDNPPWPFDDDPAYVIRAALACYIRLALTPFLNTHAERVAAASKTALPVSEDYARAYPTWQAQFANLFVSGLVALYLEEHVSEREANAFVLMETKVYGVALLPATVRVLRRYRDEAATGRYQSFAAFLPLFPKQLRVVRRIVSL
ncbi:MAG: hypothetical protein DIU68_020160, partial [Chloroflexota bacterium]